MQIHRDIKKLPHFKNAVLTIGSFDGVHVGHQKILKRIVELAKQKGGESVMITFDPHPRLVVAPKASASLRLITALEEKAQWLEHYGLDHLVVVPFTLDFANQSPDDYIRHFLVEHFQPNCIVIGYDHKYGKDRKGDLAYLQRFASQYKYEVEEISKQEISDIAISSTKVRAALSEGQVAKAASLLGHPFTILGEVVKGQQVGQRMGFPTANILVKNTYKLIPPVGIYAVQVWIENRAFGGMLYIGNRPTLQDGLGQTIEVNIFEFSEDLYGKIIRVDFLKYLRDDLKFKDLEALRLQLEKDKIAALAALSNIETITKEHS